MTYRSKLDVSILAAILFGLFVLLAGGDHWVVIPMLLVLMMCAYPESYETTPSGLLVHGALWRRLVPYDRIRFVGASEDRVRIACRPGWEFTISPAEREAFLADLADRSPHLLRCGLQLVAPLA
jgi:hypothetical protein